MTLAIPGKFTPTALSLRPGLTYEEWETAGGILCAIKGAVQWWIGDWLNYGEHAYGEKYAQAVDESQADVWRQYAYVAANVKPSIRIDSLGWSFHQLVASVPEQEQSKWLARAHDEKWTRNQLRAALHQASGLLDPPPIAQGEGRSVGVGAFMLTLYDQAGLLIVQRRDKRTDDGIVLDRSTFTDEAKALVQDFLDGGAR